MNKREKLLLEAVKAGVLGLSELSNNQMLVDDSLDDIPFVFDGEEYVLSVRKADGQTIKCDDKKSQERAVVNLLHKIGVPPHILGYTYLKDAVMLVIDKPELLDCVTKGLYPEVAEMNNSTPSRVERAIRHASQVACNHCYRTETLEQLFGNRIYSTEGNIKNSELIAKLAEVLRLEMRG